MSFNDIFKPAALIGALGAAAVGAAVGFAVGRDPQALRRLAGAAARGVGRAQLALAETTEEVIDVWEDLREQARRELEEARFEAAASAPGAVPAGKRRAPRTRAKPRTGKAGGTGGGAKRSARKTSPAADKGDEAAAGGAPAASTGTAGG